MFDRDQRPEDLTAYATAVERAGADDLWVVEDLGWAGGVSSAALALAATQRLRVGIGITPAPLRNPALLGMELATLARVFPGRLVAGVGHGVPEWMAQVGAATTAKLALLEETIQVVRTLLAGGTAQVDGRVVHIDGVRLVHPPTQPPPVVAGVVRPRSLELSGRVADGTILAEGRGPKSVAGALEHIERGREAAGDGRPHELITLAYLCVSDDAERVARAIAPIVEETARWLGVPPDEVFMVAGDAATAAGRVRELWEAGVSTVGLRPVGERPLDQVRAVLAELGTGRDA
jgi:alkanesulfonate monooxygenase SsuD/methylene tetrahydromethanopterin reductase-like flavin-dependent oxidoreductase (luciferase family)